jgi:hypothetical protein
MKLPTTYPQKISKDIMLYFNKIKKDLTLYPLIHIAYLNYYKRKSILIN